MHPAFTMDRTELGSWMLVACSKLRLRGDPPATLDAYATDQRFRPAGHNILYKLGYRIGAAGQSALLATCPSGEFVRIPGRPNDQESRARAAVWAAWREGVLEKNSLAGRSTHQIR